MASKGAADLIIARLAANWVTTPIYQWEDYREPMSSTLDPFVVLEFPGGVGNQATIAPPGSREFVDTGTFLVHVFVPTGSDLDTARDYADQIAAIFRGVQEIQGNETLLYRAPYPPYPSPPPDGTWLCLTVTIPFMWRFNA